MLGESVRNVIYYHVERSHQIRREEIPRKLEAFHQALKSLLGEGGKIVETAIARSLHRVLGLDFREHGNWTPVEYASYVKAEEGRLKG